MIIVFLLLSVFAVGTLNCLDTVEAKKWKKFHSGTYVNEESNPSYTKKMFIVSYFKDSKNIKMKFYAFKSKNNKKEYVITAYFSKTGNKIKMFDVRPIV